MNSFQRKLHCSCLNHGDPKQINLTINSLFGKWEPILLADWSSESVFEKFYYASTYNPSYYGSQNSNCSKILSESWIIIFNKRIIRYVFLRMVTYLLCSLASLSFNGSYWNHHLSKKSSFVDWSTYFYVSYNF